MPNIDNSYIWAVNTCNNPKVGYSRDYRNQQTVNGITYYDCSSFVWYALKAGQFALSGYPFTTATMRSKLLSLGFTKLPIRQTVWKPADILWRSGHTEMCYEGVGTGDGYTMGAHTAKTSLANQVSITTKLDTQKSSPFTELYRYGNGGSGATGYTWIRDPTQYRYFNQAEMENNAACVWQFFYPLGWSIQAVAALCGNLQKESTFNPDLIEHNVSDPGHGLFQWTPASDLYRVLDYLYGNHTDWGDPDGQCSALYAEYQKTIGQIPASAPFDQQWYPSLARFGYRYDSWEQWAHSTEDPGYLAMAFMDNYLRPAGLSPERAVWAREWYQFLLTVDPTGGGIPSNEKKKLKVWQMIRYHL